MISTLFLRTRSQPPMTNQLDASDPRRFHPATDGIKEVPAKLLDAAGRVLSKGLANAPANSPIVVYYPGPGEPLNTLPKNEATVFLTEPREGIAVLVQENGKICRCIGGLEHWHFRRKDHPQLIEALKA